MVLGLDIQFKENLTCIEALHQLYMENYKRTLHTHIDKNCALYNHRLKGCLGNQKWFFYGIAPKNPLFLRTLTMSFCPFEFNFFMVHSLLTQAINCIV